MGPKLTKCGEATSNLASTRGLTATGRAGSRLPKFSKNGDNGGNEHDSSKTAEEIPPEIQRRIFWCDRNLRKKNWAEISPEMNRKLT